MFAGGRVVRPPPFVRLGRVVGLVVRVRHARLSPDALASRLRSSAVPVFARVHDGAVSLDPRTLLPGDERDLLCAFQTIAASN